MQCLLVVEGSIPNCTAVYFTNYEVLHWGADPVLGVSMVAVTPRDVVIGNIQRTRHRHICEYKK